MTSALEKEFTYYLEHQDDFAKKYHGKFIVIKNCSVLGVYNSEIEAIETTKKEHDLGTFFVQKCESGNQNYTQTFHSRVAFA